MREKPRRHWPTRAVPAGRIVCSDVLDSVEDVLERMVRVDASEQAIGSSDSGMEERFLGGREVLLVNKRLGIGCREKEEVVEVV